MSEMVERVARAISHEAAFNQELIDLVVQHGEKPNDTQIVHINAAVAKALARAAIEAMREPTQVMLAWSNPPPWDKDALEVGYREVWEGMIDTALKDKAEGQS